MPTFYPPTIKDLPGVLPESRGIARDLGRHYKYSRSRSVVRRAGHWVAVDYPLDTEITETSGFLGGHTYTVTDAVAAELVADGFVVT